MSKSDPMNSAMDLAMKVTAVIMAGVALYEALNTLSSMRASRDDDDNQMRLNYDSEASEASEEAVLQRLRDRLAREDQA